MIAENSSTSAYIHVKEQNIHNHLHKKSLTIPKGKAESVYRRRTDNTTAKRKKDKWTKKDIQYTTQKTKDWATRTPLETVSELSRMASSFYNTRATRSATLVRYIVTATV